MKKIHGYTVQSLPFEGLQRISNLIEFDGPILSHYTDKFDNNFLYYWVDQDEHFNRWLIWQIPEEFLYLYLSKEISLESLFPKFGEIVYVVDIDAQINYSNIVMTYAALIDEQYRPEPDSFYAYTLPEVYQEKIQPHHYLTILREKALYFNVEPVTDRYSITVSIQDIWNVLENLGKSFTEYVEYNVKTILSERFLSIERITTAAKSLASTNRLRVVYLNLNSFHVGVAADTLNLADETMDPAIDLFKNQVMNTFKNEVLDHDFSSAADVKALIQKFPDEDARRRIFDPLIKIINNDNIRINVDTYTKDFKKTYKRVPKVEQNFIAPPKSNKRTPKDKPDQTIRVAYYVADKDAEQTLFPKDIANRILFTKDIERFPFELNKLRLPSGEEINFTHSIEIEGTLEDGNFILEYAPLGIIVIVQNQTQLEERFSEELLKLYLSYKQNNDETYSKFFKELIEELNV